MIDGPSFTSQQICPGEQHWVPQQNSLPEQAAPLHGGVLHVPLLQYGCVPVHLLPHVPQLRMSFWWFTQRSPQQARPVPQLAGVHGPVPELELAVLVLPLPVLEALLVLVLVLPELLGPAPVPVLPPEAVVVTLPPQPANRTAPMAPAYKTSFMAPA
jgi:hypothetical protein